MARPLAFPLLLLGLSVLACGGGDEVPEPWSRREGEQEVVVGNEGPGSSGPAAEDAPPARPAGPRPPTGPLRSCACPTGRGWWMARSGG